MLPATDLTRAIANATVPARAGDGAGNGPGQDSSRRPVLPLAIVGTLWAVALLAMTLAVAAYGARPGEVGDVAMHWPGDSALRLDRGQPSVVLFAHPHCPCTVASFVELHAAVTGTRSPARFVVVLVGASALGDRDHGRLERRLADVSGLERFHDGDGGEAQRFGVRTSGHVLVYGPDGRLRFSGGVTASRGHQGMSHGRQGVTEALLATETRHARTPVFGCPLRAAACDAKESESCRP